MAWGLGHTATLFVVGAAIILLNWTVPPRVGLAMEFGVALALVTVGLFNLWRPAPVALDADAPGDHPPARRAFAVGLVHGLAGSAAVALLVLATVRDPGWATAYLLVFGLGTLLGMAAVTTGLALPVAAATRRWSNAGRLLQVSTGALSLVFGIWLAVQIGWQDGLFGAAPRWTPH